MAGILVAGWDRRKGGQVLLQYTSTLIHTEYKYILQYVFTCESGALTAHLSSCLCDLSGVLCSYWWDAGEAAGVGGRKRQLLHLRFHGLQLQTWTEQRPVSGADCCRYTLLLQSMLGAVVHSAVTHCLSVSLSALSLAMERDGSSGGVIRLASISEDGVERRVILGDKLPRFSTH